MDWTKLQIFGKRDKVIDLHTSVPIRQHDKHDKVIKLCSLEAIVMPNNNNNEL